MDTKEIEIHVDKDNKIDLHEFIEMKIKYDEEYFKKDQEIERLNNIIKEVREYILTHKLYCFKYDEEELFEITTDKKAKDELLEILKGSDKE